MWAAISTNGDGDNDDGTITMKYITHFTRSYFLHKSSLKSGRIFCVLYSFLALLVNDIINFDGGAVLARFGDITAALVLAYFIIVLVVSYKFTSTSLFDLTAKDKRLAHAATVLFSIALTSTLFTTISFWAIVYPQSPTKVTFFTIHIHVINLLLILVEAVWSLMVIPFSRFGYQVLVGTAYGGFIALWKVWQNQWLYPISVENLPSGVPNEVSIVIITLFLYLVSFCLAYVLVRFRNRLYARGIYFRHESVHILDTRTF